MLTPLEAGAARYTAGSLEVWVSSRGGVRECLQMGVHEPRIFRAMCANHCEALERSASRGLRCQRAWRGGGAVGVVLTPLLAAGAAAAVAPAFPALRALILADTSLLQRSDFALQPLLTQLTYLDLSDSGQPDTFFIQVRNTVAPRCGACCMCMTVHTAALPLAAHPCGGFKTHLSPNVKAPGGCRPAAFVVVLCCAATWSRTPGAGTGMLCAPRRRGLHRLPYQL